VRCNRRRRHWAEISAENDVADRADAGQHRHRSSPAVRARILVYVFPCFGNSRAVTRALRIASAAESLPRRPSRLDHGKTSSRKALTRASRYRSVAQ
jgi:hypothetical protein